MIEKCNEYALMFKAFSDPNRLLIINLLIDGERCACVILDQLHISQPTLSYHMKILCESSIINARKEGKWMHYSLNNVKLAELKTFMDNLNEANFSCNNNFSCK